MELKMTRKLAAMLPLCFAIFFGGLNAWAQEAYVTQLDAVVVTASRGESAKKEVTSNIMVVDAETLANSSAVNLGELMAELGFQSRIYPGANNPVCIRGYAT